LANKSPNLSAQTRSDIEKIEKASLYAREIIRKLMFFSRQAPARKIDVDLQIIIEESLSLLKTRCDTAGIKVVLELGSSLGLIHGDPSQLQQILVNLIVNAVQAMPKGGTLTIRTLQEADSQCMIVEDTGSGIAPDDIKNVFLPFFTTKDVGEGTGLGLSVVHGIVTSHGGSVHVESRVDHGTRFKVRLPAKVKESIESNDDEE
jgi:signal transduction histidine kinase